MLKTSGLILDVHDDVGGEVLRSFFPMQKDIPETVKQAFALTAAERERLPDEDFALVLTDGEQRLRKFACIDEGNTQLAVLYFMANAHKLPEEAQKTAAANLLTACSWYDLEPPAELEKVALGMIQGLNLLSLPATAKGVQTQVKQNLGGIRAHEAAGQTVVSPHEMKMAEMSNTSLMPGQPPADRSVRPSKTVVAKTAARAMQPYVDVSGKDPHSPLREKRASIYALEEQYPLDNYMQVKQAASYFDEYWKRMAPEDRRSYCVQLIKRAGALGIQVSDEARKYGGGGYAPDAEIKLALDARRNALVDDAAVLILDELEEKRAAIDPDLFRVTLEEFDKATGINQYYDSYVPDAYYSTYGEKMAEMYSFISGNDSITEDELERFGKTMHKSLAASFGDDFATEFRKDPVAIFKSLPLVQKKMIIHMASDNAPGAEIVP